MFDPVELAFYHNETLKKYEEKLSEEQKQKALKDPHARRYPRPCGFTVHLVVGCPFDCTYCYIYDMNFDRTPKPVQLKPDELVYSLLKNPNFISGRWGSLIAIGSISEPFIFPELALDYLRELSMLGNPMQFSTKSYLSRSYSETLSHIKTTLNPLVTIVTIELTDILEPKAPSVDKRLETIRNLSSAGFKVSLFLRPIIAGVNYEEAETILKLAHEAGANAVIIGSFRITYRIYMRLKELGLNLRELEGRVNMRKLRKMPSKQFTVPLTQKERSKLILLAREIGLTPFKSACCSNSSNAGVTCPSICFETGFCTKCPNMCQERPRPAVARVKEALRILGLTVCIENSNDRILISDRKYRSLVQVLSRRLL
ncbi:MAG: radical SAM protein [Crenarchaeota archaeon]|nr:radical SAM protein [Thermoproteota archaeon]MCR8488352.1 radical SAM protein [Thermoproteota archaeon]